MFRRNSRCLVRAVSIASALSLFWPAGAKAQLVTLPSARDVVDRYVQAIGGAAAFKALKSMRARGTFNITAQQLTGDLEMVAARPNRLLTRVTVTGIGQLEEGYDGKVGWSLDPLNGPSLVTGRALQERSDEAWFDAPLHGDDCVREMTVVGREDLNKRPVYRLKVISIGGTEQIEFYDVETGLQVGVEASRDTPLGIVPTATYYKDYQKFGALTFPSTVVQRVLGIEQIFTFTSYEFDTVAQNAFELPAVIKALIK